MDNRDFIPAVRFCVASDTHISEERSYGTERIAKILALAYELSAKDNNYTALDAAAFVGDLTDAGEERQYEMFFREIGSSLREGTKPLFIVAKGHDCNTMGKAALGFFNERTGLPTDFHYVINGFHYIGVSTCEDEGIYYNEKQRVLLKNALDEAVADSPSKPVFVFHHEHVKRTVYGSSNFDGWGNDYFNDILFEYPQIVDFSGHSHYPLNDPRSIWQGEITALGTGAAHYAEFTADGERRLHPEGFDETAQFFLVEADAENNVRIRGYDALNSALLCEYFIENPADKNARQYTPAMQEARAKAPYFKTDAKPVITKGAGKTAIRIPQAESSDGEIIFAYRIVEKDSGGKELSKRLIINKYWLANPGDILYEIADENTVGVTVTAENAFGMKSEELDILI
ncbi:MAG: hypothetical protein IK097_04135 [Clostridia bacterium]|nr:hypothetical protein [Clostridia bacterium]